MRYICCVIQVFLKVLETFNKDNESFRGVIRNSEKAYNKLIDIVSNTPLSVNEPEIKPMFRHFFTIFEQQDPAKQKEKENKPEPVVKEEIQEIKPAN